MNKVTLKQKRNEQDRRNGRKYVLSNISGKAAYWDGANAVLEEIESCMQNKEDTVIDWVIQIRNKIRELKGE